MNNFFKSVVNWLFLFLFLGIMTLLQMQLWFGETGYEAHEQLKADIQHQQDVNMALQNRNRILYAEMEDLRNGLDVVEEYARLDLGLIRKNETFVQINTTKAKQIPVEFQNQPEVKIAPMMVDIIPDVKGR